MEILGIRGSSHSITRYSDSFEKFNDEQVWASWKDFEIAFMADVCVEESQPEVVRELNRHKSLCHPWALEVGNEAQYLPSGESNNG